MARDRVESNPHQVLDNLLIFDELDVIKNGGVLFFSKHPENIFPQAVIRCGTGYPTLARTKSRISKSQFKYDQSPKEIAKYNFNSQQLTNIIPDTIQKAYDLFYKSQLLFVISNKKKAVC